jgi:RNA polymerase sigma-70 factor (ECF subfamily)
VSFRSPSIDPITDSTLDAAQRRAVFDRLAGRYQDMAYACALSLLRDRQLAEDAAQDALVTAWLNLDNLREPAAFPAWLRRIVTTRCGRIRRARQREDVTLDALLDLPAGSEGPEDAALRAASAEGVRALLDRLPEGEREAVTLFYIHDYNLAEISSCLGISAAAAKQRLYSARRRLQANAMEVFGEEMRRGRPSGSARFAERLRARLRPLDQADWEQVTQLVAAVDSHGSDEIQWALRHRNGRERDQRIRRHYVAAEGKLVAGYGSVEPFYGDDEYRVSIVAPDDELTNGTGAALWSRLYRDLQDIGASHAWALSYGSETSYLNFLRACGFQDDTRLIDLRRHIGAEGSEPAAELAPGTRIVTAAEARETDPALTNKLIEYWDAVEAAWHGDDAVRRAKAVVCRVQAVDAGPERHFLCLSNGRILGAANLGRKSDLLPERSWITLGIRPEMEPGPELIALRQRAESLARERGHSTLFVVIRGLCRARRLYHGAGFHTAFEYLQLGRPVGPAPAAISTATRAHAVHAGG